MPRLLTICTWHGAMVRVTQLIVYPVKSCRGVSVERAVIAPTGLRFDRNWIITDPSGTFFTQREKSQLALVEVEITPVETLTNENIAGEHAGELILRAPGMSELRVSLDRSGKEDKRVPVGVWDWQGEGNDEGPEAAAWLSKYLDTDARLVRYAGAAGADAPIHSDPARRTVDPMWTASPYETAFSDCFPFLLASEASLEALNQELASPIPINRFRPNILVGGDALAPWAEDSWRQVSVGRVTFECVKPCDRCTVPTINQETAVKSPDCEPTETLHKIRSGRVLGWTNPKPFKNSVFFAWNLVTKDSGSIAVGDEVEVVSSREGAPVPFLAAA